jgi:ATP phosphoribosyltransferase regulatory subunit
MALQPAAGVRDLNPGEVEQNRRICAQLSAVYRHWGYQQLTPPSVERSDTLAAGGAINEREIVRLVSGEPLGLRPELTAPIARAACTRLASQPRPLRLWSEGTIFRSWLGEGGAQRIQEQLQSGVELLGEPSAAAEAELLRLLLAAVGSLGLEERQRPRLLVGHHGLLSLLLERLPEPLRPAARTALSGLDALALASLPVGDEQRLWLQELSRLRGAPAPVLEVLTGWLGQHPLVANLTATLELVMPAAARHGVSLQLDPTFQPHFSLYDGLVLKLVCQGSDAPVAIASGGRYDALVGRFCPAEGPESQLACGVGFGFDIDAIRELAIQSEQPAPFNGRHLVAFSERASLAAALDALETLHAADLVAELHGQPLGNRAAAEALAAQRGCSALEFLD